MYILMHSVLQESIAFQQLDYDRISAAIKTYSWVH